MRTWINKTRILKNIKNRINRKKNKKKDKNKKIRKTCKIVNIRQRKSTGKKTNTSDKINLMGCIGNN